jgi:hypothetical protein
MDLEVDEFSRCLLLGEPLPQAGQWHVVDGDVLTAHTATLVFADEIAGVEKMGELRGHAGRCRTGDEGHHRARPVAGFFEKFSSGGGGERFSSEFRLVAYQASRHFDDVTLHGNAELLDQDDFPLGCDREDADAGFRAWTADEVPVADAIESEPAAFEKCFWGRHGLI